MSTLTDFVSTDESVLVRWEGALQNGGGATDVVLGTTDRCVVYCTEGGQFGLFPREHVSSVESRVENVAEYDFEDYRLFVGGGAAISATTFVGGILASSGLLALVLFLGTCCGLWLVEHGWRNRETYDGVKRRVSQIERVVVQTDAGGSTVFLFPVDARAGAELGKFLRAE